MKRRTGMQVIGQVLALAVGLGLTLGAVSVDADDVAAEDKQAAPIVLEPSAEEAPPVVQLDPTADADGDPLLIGAFSLIDQDGESFADKDVAGQPWVAAFIFTRCAGYCPTLVRDLKLEVADRLEGDDVRFVVISVDPDHDTPAKLKQYGEVYSVDFDRWAFLTGDKAEIYKLVQHGFRLGLQEAEGADRLPGFEVAHSLSLMHVGADGRVIGKYDSRDAQQILSLRRVLSGQIETPKQNRVLATASVADEVVSDEPVTIILTKPDPLDKLPTWAARLPTTNAMLNSLATLLLIGGFIAIKQGHATLHKKLMLFAFATSVVFLGCYLTYHFALNHFTGTHGKPFEGTGGVRTAYFILLISHVILAAIVPLLAITTISRGLKGQWESHRRIARITFPIWLYVSVTGVIIYGMLYHWSA